MAKVRIGDTVRFLNDIGGGIVRNVLRSGLVYVEDESGFEIPVMENEVVVVIDGSTIVPKPQPNQSIKDALGTIKPKSAPSKANSVAPSSRKRSEDKEGEKLNVSLCYLVELGGVLGKDNYELYLVNESNYDLMVLYASGKGEQKVVRYSGIIPFDTSELLEHFSPSDLPQRERTVIQLIALKSVGETMVPKEPMTIDVKVDGARFFKENAFVENPFFDDRALVIELVKDDQPLQRKKINVEKLQEEMLTEKINTDLRKKSPRKRAPQTNEPLEIDLHIHELVDTTVGMEPKHILDMQLSKVRKVMEHHKKPKDRGKQIVFIHGKGEGVLRKAVTDLIAREYPKCDMQDASFQEYGFGATKVTIK